MASMELSTQQTIEDKRSSQNARQKIIILAAVIAICVAVIMVCVTVTIIYTTRDDHKTDHKDSSIDNIGSPEKSEEVHWPEVDNSDVSSYRFASTASSEPKCSEAGTKVMAEGGSAVDAAIATVLCLGVKRTLSSGIGGGAFMTYYDKSSAQAYIFDFREVAPLLSNSTMYENTTLKSNIGGGSIGVPGEVAGLWMAHQRFGKLQWSRLFQSSIRLAREGYELNSYIHNSLKKNYDKLGPELRTVFTNENTAQIKEIGDIIKLPKLADTLERIAEGGADVFYKGALKEDILADLSEIEGSIMTNEDLETYGVTERNAITSHILNGDFTIISPPPPSGGLVVQYILNILSGFNFTPESVSSRVADVSKTATTFHRMIEAMKFAYAKRSNFGDESFVNMTQYKKDLRDPEYCTAIRQKITDDMTHNFSYYGLITDERVRTGTSQVSVIAGNGDAVSVTTSINSAWGSKRMGKRTGIIFNSHMADFSHPGKPSWTDDAWTAPSNEANWIEPGKKPLSSMSPTVVLDKDGNVRLVTGGSGGSKTITATVFTIVNNMWFNLSLAESVSRPRLHHQLLPEHIMPEPDFPQVYLDELVKKGHELKFNTHIPVSDSCSVENGYVYGVADPRRLGGSDGF